MKAMMMMMMMMVIVIGCRSGEMSEQIIEAAPEATIVDTPSDDAVAPAPAALPSRRVSESASRRVGESARTQVEGDEEFARRLREAAPGLRRLAEEPPAEAAANHSGWDSSAAATAPVAMRREYRTPTGVTLEGAASARSPAEGNLIDWELSAGVKFRGAATAWIPSWQMNDDEWKVAEVEGGGLWERENGRMEWGYRAGIRAASRGGYEVEFTSKKKSAAGIDRQSFMAAKRYWGVRLGVGVTAEGWRGAGPGAFIDVPLPGGRLSGVTDFGDVWALDAEARKRWPLGNGIEPFAAAALAIDGAKRDYQIKVGLQISR